LFHPSLSECGSVDIGAIGIEGMTSVITLVGFDKTVLEAIVQIPGSAFRMSRDAAVQAMQTEKAFRQIAQDYARFAVGQLLQTAACKASSRRTLLSLATDCA
jgi:hypothetical protein